MRIIILLVILFAVEACNNVPSGESGQPEAIASVEDAHDEHEGLDENELHPQEGSDITFLKLGKKPFSFVLRTGGRLTVDSRDVVIITAKSSGLVRLNDDFLFPGVRVSKGDILFTISGEALAEGNTQLNFLQIKADLERASANYERSKRLIEDRIITEQDFLAAKNEYEKLKHIYDNFSSTSGEGGNVVRSGTFGYIKEIFVTEGQKVSAGDRLASVVLEHNMVLQADVPPDMISMLPSVRTANFTVGYSDSLYSIDRMNGRKISQGKSAGESSYYIPVYFRMDHIPGLIDGTFAEVYLIGGEIANSIVVPNTSLMEEFGKIYVFVTHPDGDFEKRYITPGHTDGRHTLVKGGLSENETIVATGTYRVKLSQTAAAPPAHSHDH